MDTVESVSLLFLLLGNTVCVGLFLFFHDAWVAAIAMGCLSFLTILVLLFRRLLPMATPPLPRHYLHVDARMDECIICYELLAQNVVMLPCAHVYHEACIVEWFRRKYTCPYCLRSVLDP